MKRAATRVVFSLIVASAAAWAEDDAARHPHAQTIERYREARRAGDTEALAAILSEDSRIWFDEKKGPGTRRDPTGSGPWSGWDSFFRSESDILDFHVDGASVRTTVTEINDWYRLVERAPSVYYITYYFDADGRIAGTLIDAMPDRPKRSDRLPEFEAWAREHEPGLLEELMPDDRIDPAKAELWKAKLLEWRASAGLGNPLGVR
jgi:hypothetical protein